MRVLSMHGGGSESWSLPSSERGSCVVREFYRTGGQTTLTIYSLAYSSGAGAVGYAPTHSHKAACCQNKPKGGRRA